MTAKKKIAMGIVGAVLIATPAAVALAQPQAAACVLIEYRGLEEVAPSIFASSDVTGDQRRDFLRLHAAAKLRIANTFGETHASPVIVLGSTEALRDVFSSAGPYASTIYVPYRSCVLVGPNGHDVNILAHEALHAEIHHRVGHWHRLTEIPTWFDEGLAMQVDSRERYRWSLQFGTVSSGTVRQWTSRSQFFKGDDDELTRHYAMAKEEIRQWVQKLGRERVYGFLERVRQGDRFVEIYEGRPSNPSQRKESRVSTICVVYHSAYGHTKAKAAGRRAAEVRSGNRFSPRAARRRSGSSLAAGTRPRRRHCSLAIRRSLRLVEPDAGIRTWGFVIRSFKGHSAAASRRSS